MGLKRYAARRVAWAAVATWIAVSATFVLLWLSPDPGADVAAAEAAAQGLSPEQAQERYLAARGLDRPAHVQYLDFVTSVFTLDWGWSVSQNEPVMEALGESWGHTVQYAVPAMAVSVVVGYGVGLYTAVNQHTAADYVGSFVAYVGISIPNFWFAIVLILVSGVWFQDATVLGLSLEPLSFRTFYDPSIDTFTVANARQLVLPTTVLATASVASQMRYSRAEALEYVAADFVRTARAKGASGWRILTRHVFRVALVPLSTILVVQVLTVLFAGSIVVEQIFAIPGLGRLYLDAIRGNDTQLVLVITLFPVVIAILGNLLQDLAYVILDPRIDYGDR